VSGISDQLRINLFQLSGRGKPFPAPRPHGQFVPALVSFNVGVELGQLAVITAAYLAVGIWVAWYGRLVAPAKAPLQPAYPVELAPYLKVPVLGLYGGADASIPVEHVEQMRAVLKGAGNTVSEIVLYDGAPHAFYADYRPSYRKEAAEDGWKRMQAWFRKYGVA
jgi:dienelactone hydrolase